MSFFIEDDVLNLSLMVFSRFIYKVACFPYLQDLTNERRDKQRHKVCGTLTKRLKLDNNRSFQPIFGFHTGLTNIINITDFTSQKAPDTNFHNGANISLSFALVARFLDRNFKRIIKFLHGRVFFSTIVSLVDIPSLFKIYFLDTTVYQERRGRDKLKSTGENCI